MEVVDAQEGLAAQEDPVELTFLTNETLHANKIKRRDNESSIDDEASKAFLPKPTASSFKAPVKAARDDITEERKEHEEVLKKQAENHLKEISDLHSMYKSELETHKLRQNAVKSELRDALRRISEKQREVETFELAMRKKDNDIRSITASVEESKDEIDSLQYKLSMAREEISTLLLERDSSRKENQVQNETISELKELKAKESLQVETLETKILLLRKENSSLISQNKSLTERIKSIAENLSDLKGKYEEEQEIYRNAKVVDDRELVLAKEKMYDLEVELKNIVDMRPRQQLLEDENARLSKRADTDEKMISELKETIKQLKCDMISVLKESQNTIQEVERLRDVDASKEDMESQLRTSRNAMATYMSEVKRLEKKAMIEERGRQQLRKELKQQQIAICSERAEIKARMLDFKDAIENKEIELEEFNVQMDLLLEQVLKSTENVTAADIKDETKIGELIAQNASLKSMIEQLKEGPKKQLDEQKDVFEKKQLELEIKLNDAEGSVKNLAIQLERAREENRAQITLNTAAIEEKQAKDSQDGMEIEVLKSELENLRKESGKEIQALQIEIEVSKKELAAKEKLIEIAESKLIPLQDEARSKKSQDEAKTEALEQELEKLRRRDNESETAEKMKSFELEIEVLRVQLVAKDEQIELQQNELAYLRDKVEEDHVDESVEEVL